MIHLFSGQLTRQQHRPLAATRGNYLYIRQLLVIKTKLKVVCCFTSKWRHKIPLCLTCLFLFLMIKDTLLPTVQKHTLENTGHFQITCKQPRESQKWELRAEGSARPSTEGKFRELGTADDDLSNQGAKRVTQQQYCGRKGHNCIPHGEEQTYSMFFFVGFFLNIFCSENFQLMV